MNHVIEGLKGYKNEVDPVGDLNVEVLSYRLNSHSDLDFLSQYESLYDLQILFCDFAVQYECL